MKNGIKSCILLFLCGICVSCGNQRQPSANIGNVTIIDAGIEDGEVNAFDALVEDVRFVPLETSDEVLIGEIEKIVYYNSEYYVADKGGDGFVGGIYRFDSEGRFLNKIGYRGRGPGEYVNPADFIVNSSGLIVLDLKRFILYDHDGTFKREGRHDYILYEITGMPDENLIFAVAGDNRHIPEAKGYEVLILDIEGNLMAAYLPSEYVMNYRYTKKSFLYDGKVVYSRPFHKYVYCVDDNGAVGKYGIVLRDSPLPDNYEEVCRGDFRQFIRRYQRKYNYFGGGFLENDYMVFFTTMSKERKRYWNVYNKRTQEVYTGLISLSQIKPINAKGMIISGLGNYLTTGDNGDIIGRLNAADLSFDFGGHRDGFPVLASVKEDDNPVIFHFKFRD